MTAEVLHDVLGLQNAVRVWIAVFDVRQRVQQVCPYKVIPSSNSGDFLHSIWEPYPQCQRGTLPPVDGCAGPLISRRVRLHVGNCANYVDSNRGYVVSSSLVSAVSLG
jgi:hypothetical protein